MQAVYTIFADFEEWLVPVHDNVLIGAHDPQDMLRKVTLVLERCSKFNIQLKLKKSKFGLAEIKSFGYVVQEGKYTVELARIRDIMEIPFPKTQKQVQRFLGCCTFISPFISNYTDTFRHIFRMSHKDFKLSLKVQDGTDYEAEWSNVKKHLVHTPTVYFPRRELEWQTGHTSSPPPPSPSPPAACCLHSKNSRSKPGRRGCRGVATRGRIVCQGTRIVFIPIE